MRPAILPMTTDMCETGENYIKFGLLKSGQEWESDTFCGGQNATATDTPVTKFQLLSQEPVAS